MQFFKYILPGLAEKEKEAVAVLMANYFIFLQAEKEGIEISKGLLNQTASMLFELGLSKPEVMSFVVNRGFSGNASVFYENHRRVLSDGVREFLGKYGDEIRITKHLAEVRIGFSLAVKDLTSKNNPVFSKEELEIRCIKERAEKSGNGETDVLDAEIFNYE